MAVACSSCTRIDRRAGSRFCHRCGREWQTGRRAWPKQIATAAEAEQEMVYKAVGYRAIGAILTFVALALLMYCLIQRAGEAVGFPLVVVVVAAVVSFVKSGHYLEAARAMQRQFKSRMSSQQQRIAR
jgi:hypothetical protein